MIDVQEVICQHLISDKIANGNVIIADSVVNCDLPAVFVSETSTAGNTWECYYETTLTVTCSTISEYETVLLADKVRRSLDGWGGYGIHDVQHVSTIPQRVATTPTIFSRVLTFRAVYQEI